MSASNEILVIFTAARLPGSPSSLVATVVGTNVTLTWAPPSSGGSPTSYVIEAGSSPGLINLANISTGTTVTVFSAAGVPAGAYYVRVKAANLAGTSGASNEVLVIVR